MPSYYDGWEQSPFQCDACGWSGIGSQLARGEAFNDLFEIECPKCNKRLGTVTYPKLNESRENWSKVSQGDRIVVTLFEAQLKAEAAKVSAQTSVRRLAEAHRKRLYTYVTCNALVAILFSWLGSWANSLNAWEATITSFLLMGICIVAFFGVFFFLILICSWHKKHESAIELAVKYTDDPTWFKAVYKEVIGPIPW